jgi:hypothetical protein
MFKVNNVMQNTMKYRAFVLLTAVIAFSGCRKIFNLPDEKSYLSTQADYTTKSWSPILGRTNLYTNVFSAVGSTFPITFEVKNPRFGDGNPATDMLTVKPTLVWTQEYTGKETSLAQIEAKRHLENHPVLELRGSGDVVWWYTADTTLIRPSDIDTIVYPQNERYFDVKLTNSGGTRTIKNLVLTPRVNQPYYPTDDYNTYTGKPNTTTPGGHQLVRMYPSGISNITGESTNQPVDDPRDATKGIVYVYIRRFTTDPNGHRLRIKVLNTDSTAIDPVKFNTTKWVDQVHGFKADGTPGADITHEYVEYNVAYPIPLAVIPTKYTVNGVGNLTGGDMAQINLTYSRVAFGDIIKTATITQNFQIWEKGDWEIVFHFKTVNPKFEND